MTVYFIQSDCGRIKIGYTSAESSAERLASLQTASPSQLRLLAEIPRARVQGETYLHRMFAKDRVQGEWFAPSAELKALVARVASGEHVLGPEHFDTEADEFDARLAAIRAEREAEPVEPRAPFGFRWSRIYDVWWQVAECSPSEEFEHVTYSGDSASGWTHRKHGFTDQGQTLLKTAKLLHRLGGDPEKTAAAWLLAALRQDYPNARATGVLQDAQGFRDTCVEVLGEEPVWSHGVRHTLPMRAELRAKDSLTWESFSERIALLRALILANYKIVMRWEPGSTQRERQFACSGLVQA